MGVQGKLTREKMGYSMPVDAPAFSGPPGHFKQANFIRFDYITDAESASELIPEQLSLTDPATAVLMFGHYPWSTIGSYKEAMIGVNVEYKGEAMFFPTYLILDKAGFGGREVVGYPKKMGIVEFTKYDDVMGAYVERPKGIRICSGVMRPEQPIDMSMMQDNVRTTCTLRVIPNPDKSKPHSLVELIRTDTEVSETEIWMGTGSCTLSGESALDPWHKLPVKEMLMSCYAVGDFTMGNNSKVMESL